MDNTKLAYKVSVVTIVVNIILSVFKLISGIVGNSDAMISDAVHSASDVLTTIVVIIGFALSSKKADHGHQYGHERLECIAATVLSVMLLITGAIIGYNGLLKIITADFEVMPPPGKLAMFAAIISVAVKEWMYWYTRAAASKINSTSLAADAVHHRSDALSSIGSLVGIAGAMRGFRFLDPLAGFIIAILIIKAAIDVFLEAMGQMVDKACSGEVEQMIMDLVLSVDGVVCVDELKTRMFGSKIYVDVELCADGTLTLLNSHEIAETVHKKIETEIPAVKHCMVHMNPV